MSATQREEAWHRRRSSHEHAVLAYASTSTTAWLVIHPDWAMRIPFALWMLWLIADERRRRLS